MDRFNELNLGRAIFVLLATITVIIVGAVLKITSSIMLLFTISLLLALVISPLVNFLQKFHIPKIASILLVVIFLIGGLYAMGMILYSSGRTLATLYPRYEARITEIYVWVANFFELPYDEHLSIFENIWGQAGIRNLVRDMTLDFSSTFLGFVTNAVMMVIIMIFILIEAVFFKEKLNRAFEGTRAGQIIKIGSDIMTQVTRYLSIKFIISLVTGLLVGIGLRIVGVEFAAVWGLIQFVLNFIPNIGSIVVGVSATLFALVQFWPDPVPIVAAGLVMLFFNMVIGVIIDPKIMGDNLGISPLMVLVSLMIWGWLWGFAGLILAVPMISIIKIFCENIPVLEPISILLGSHKAVLAVKSAEEKKGKAGEE